MIGLLAFAQATAPMPAPPPATPSSVTQPVHSIKCNLKGSDWADARLDLESRGSRGYVKAGTVLQSPAEFVVIADPKGALRTADKLMDNRASGGYSGQWADNTLSAEITQSGIQISAQFQPAGNRVWMIKIWTDDLRIGSGFPTVTHVGFCTAQQRLQTPLNAAEVKRLSSK